MDISVLDSVAVLLAVDLINPSFLLVTSLIVIVFIKEGKAVMFRKISLYAFSVFVPYFLFGCLSVILGRAFDAQITSMVESEFGLWLRFIVGAVLIILGIALPVSKDSKKLDTFIAKSEKLLTSQRIVILGLIVTLAELPTAIPYLAAINILVTSSMATIFVLAIVFIYCFVMVLPAYIIPVAVRDTDRFYNFMRKQYSAGQTTLLVIITLMGFWLVSPAAKQLFGWG